jgi:DNA primase
MAERYVSFDEVKMRVSMEQLLDHYGLLDSQTQRKGAEIVLHCVFHDDTTPSLKINTVKNVFNCFGCNQGGDQIAFVVLQEGIATGDPDRDRREAALLIQEWFHLASGKRPTKQRPRRTTRKRKTAASVAAPTETDVDSAAIPAATDPTGTAAEPTEPARDGENAAVVNPPLTFASKQLDPTHSYLAERGLTKDTIEYFGLGYHAGKGMMHGRIVIPIHDTDGQLVAYAGRFPEDDPPEGEDKYKFPPNFKKSLVLYNLHRAREHVHASDGLIVVEGFFSGVFALFQRGRKNVVAIMGSALSEAQEHLIVETVGPRGRVLLAFDPDEAGRKGMQEAAARLVSHVFVRTVAL